MYLGSDMLNRLVRSAILVVATAGVARAGATTPTLIVQAAEAGSGIPGALRLMTFHVAYDYSNAIQADYDVELIVFQGNSFVRFPISGAARFGSSSALADGFTVSDLPALDAASSPTPDSTRVVTIEPTRLTVSLPASFGSGGGADVVLAATVDEGVIQSNPLHFILPTVP